MYKEWRYSVMFYNDKELTTCRYYGEKRVAMKEAEIFAQREPLARAMVYFDDILVEVFYGSAR